MMADPETQFPSQQLQIETADKPPDMLALIARAAADPSVDVAKMQALLDMQRQLMADQARQLFDEAFERLKPKLPRVKKNGRVTYDKKPGGFAYAKYEDIDEAIAPLLNAEGFHLSYDSQPLPDGRITVIGTLYHVAGHCKTATIGPLPLDTSGGKNNVQAVGSTVSYGKRYTATMLLDLVFEGEDDDGQKGGNVTIDEASYRSLSELIPKGELDAFLKFMQVEALGDILVADYPRAVNALMAKRRRTAAESKGTA